ncbi:hypothetical protein D3C78_1324820 [compost metagenome]
MHFLPGLGEPALAEFLVHGRIHAERIVPLDLVALLPLHAQVVVGLDAGHPLIVDVPMLVVLDMPGDIVLDKQVQVFLTVDVNLFLPSLVFKAQLVEPFPLVGFGAQHGTGLVGR